MGISNDPRSWTLDGYLARGLPKIAGWLEAPDARLLALVNEAMRSRAVTGDILEIGTFFGRSAIVLGFLLNDPGERLVVSDFFDLPHVRYTGPPWEGRRPRPTRAQFEANYRRYHAQLPTIVEGPSRGLDPTNLGRKRFRIVHIDGGHEWEDVDRDTDLARELLHTEGVVVFDDVISHEFPAVAARVWADVTSGLIHPIALTWKLYATFEPNAAIASEIRQLLVASTEFEVFPRVVAGCEFLQIGPWSEPRSAWLSRPSKEILRDLSPPIAYRTAGRIKDRIWRHRH